jgi:hypothetical protein
MPVMDGRCRHDLPLGQCGECSAGPVRRQPTRHGEGTDERAQANRDTMRGATRHGEPWTRAEDDRLRAMHDARTPESEVTRVLGRSLASVYNRRRVLGLSPHAGFRDEEGRWA